ncbi:MAG: hypothetical protein JST75_09350 [Bacteroidetes bacterium]|nr:hypothetical protein [Bacteroidota bacterium]
MNRKKINIISYLIIIIFFVAWVIWGLAAKHNLDSNHKICIGTITGYTQGGRGNAGTMTVEFSFTLNGKVYQETSAYQAINLPPENFNKNFAGKSFPVLYYTNNPKNAVILITPSVFNHFGVSFPDSLNWVLKHINEN